MSFCEHPNLGNDPRRDYCSECKYEFYYGDERQISKLVNAGRDRKANGYPSREEMRERELEEKYEKEAWDDYYASQRDDEW